MAVHGRYGPEARRALELEERIPSAGWEREVARGLELGLLDVWRTTRTTILLVTHDVEEAVFLSQRIYVL